MYYFNSIIDNKNFTYSIDMLRLKFKLSISKQKVFIKFLQDNYNFSYTTSYGSYKYRYLFRIFFNNLSFSIGLNLNGMKKVDFDTCFIEFNPNKILPISQFQLLFSYLKKITTFDIVNYDFAVDIPVARSLCFMQKDRRDYKKFVYGNDVNNFTEYLGATSDVGRCKLYNKKLESNLDYDLTRFEITTKFTDYNFFIAQIPAVYFGCNYDVIQFSKLSSTEKVLLTLLLQSPDCNIHFKGLSRSMQVKLKSFICDDKYKLSIPNDIFDSLMGYINKLIA